MFQRIKAAARDLLPGRFQVPAKYWFGRATGGIEAEMALLPLLVRRGDRVVDVGGNRGAYAYCLGALGARVEVFEPNPACHRMLAAWAGGNDAVTIYAVALSAEEGQGELLVPVGPDGVEHDSSGSLEHGSDGAVRHLPVPLRPLDSFGIDDAALVKIDVEGHEASVIAGARRTIAASKPALLIEIEQRHLARPIGDVFAEIMALGYEGYFLKAGRLAPLADFVIGRDQALDRLGVGVDYHNNFLFLAPERIAHGDYAGALAARV